ncbi:hypothetical protein DL546_007776 [Coniochaeta pulveracea]|uniref:RING-type domain-containing protein n=1 Tax=Coniochaeta pulveracea TaxID=177199 RepID=A0A420YNS0_9PEZI|nr:hypothetical protein DL546_007776 [Coniochaeta pulveracea]
MCNELTFVFGCHHTEDKIWPCAKAKLCKSRYRNGTVTHPGECPECLGGRSWPMATFTFSQDRRGADRTNHEYCLEYAQSWIDWVVLLLATTYEDFADGDNDNPMSYDSVAADVMRTMYRETMCRECDKPHLFGKPCTSCTSTRSLTSILGNPVISYRREVAQKECDYYFGRHLEDLDEWELQQVREIIKEEAICPDHGTLMHRVLSVPPSDVNKCLNKYFAVLRQIMDDVVTGGLDRPGHGQDGLHLQHEAYTMCAGLVLNIVVCMMAFDTGLKTYYMRDIMKCLVHMLVHPTDYRNPFPTVAKELDLRNFQCVMLCYTRTLEAPTKVMKALFLAVESDFRSVRNEHRMAIAKTIPEPEDIMRTRLHLHTTKVLNSDEDCPICLSPMSEEVLQLKCSHQFHFECVLSHMREANAGKNLCGICRASIDEKEKDEKGIYGIKWFQALNEEVDIEIVGNNRMFVDAEGPELKWPMLRDTLAGLGWEREEVKPVNQKGKGLWRRH